MLEAAWVDESFRDLYDDIRAALTAFAAQGGYREAE
jgi:hypothetical protein